MKINPEIFREYDIRGTVDRDLNPEFAYLLGRAYAQLAKENHKDDIAIGYDTRLSSPEYSKSLAQGMADEGVRAWMTGMGPTPQLYYALYTKIEGVTFGGGIQVTGSHNPSDMNGFKICLGTQTLSGPDIQNFKERMLKLQGSTAAQIKSPAKISVRDMRQTYIDELIQNSKSKIGPRKLKVVVDAGNGVGGLVGPAVLKALGCEVIELYCEPDGRFPNHHPDPTVLENIEDLIKKVKETKADFGIGWDGDADRIGVVDEQGHVIFGDMLLLIYAREILKSVPKATVIGDVKCSSLLFSDLVKRGANAIMWKTGHSLIKNKLKETGGELAGEMSGHICFKHRWYGFDDALYSTTRFVEIVSNTTSAVSQLLADLPKTVSTPEIREDCPEALKFKISELAKAAFSQYEVTTIDGVRVNFDQGWALVRASNTQPVLVMRFEANNQTNLEKYQRIVRDKISEIKNSL